MQPIISWCNLHTRCVYSVFLVRDIKEEIQAIFFRLFLWTNKKRNEIIFLKCLYCVNLWILHFLMLGRRLVSMTKDVYLLLFLFFFYFVVYNWRNISSFCLFACYWKIPRRKQAQRKKRNLFQWLYCRACVGKRNLSFYFFVALTQTS